MKRKKYGLVFRRKKADAILDSIMIMIVLFTFSIISILGFQFFGDLDTDIQANADLNNQSKEISSDVYTRYPGAIDGLFLFLVFLIWGFVIVASFMIDSHPIFFIFSIILFIAVLIVAGMFANFFQEFFTDASLSTLTANFPIMNYILTHFVEIILGMGFSVILVLYGKSRFN